MKKVIAIANQKGGVGKSTMTVQLAFYLSQKKKKKVLVIDMDSQGNSTTSLTRRGEIPLTGTSTVELYKDDAGDIVPMLCPMANHKSFDKEYSISLISTIKNDPALYDMESVEIDKIINPAKNLAKIADNYDYILIDCPPSLGRNLLSALIMATNVITPVQLSSYALDGVEGLVSTVIGVQERLNENLEFSGIIVNNLSKSKHHMNVYAELKEKVPHLLFDNIIEHRPPLDQASSQGVPIWTLGFAHVASKEVLKVLNEIYEKLEA